ncbi:MAG: MotA/TolQ/ExbB proton channel family protein [Pseudomonadota bacterium]
MLEIIRAGGWVMWPILAASIVSIAIIIERFWTLRASRVVPIGLSGRTFQQIREGAFQRDKLLRLREESPLGFLLSAAITGVKLGRDGMRARVDQAGRQVVHEMERYLTTLGAIASVATLLGLLGSVIGMIHIFNAVTASGGGETVTMARGIAMALIATAGGLAVAIPAQFFYRFFTRQVDTLAMSMETEVLDFIDRLVADRGTAMATGNDVARESA